jgi:hypothetical protein
MASLKAQMEQDMTDVFLNGDEFAEDMNIDGKTVLAVLTDEPSKMENAEGMAVIGKRLLAKTADLPPLSIGKTLTIDHVLYAVQSEPETFGGGTSVLLAVNYQ